MNELVNVENKKQKRPKPPRNLGRIACEIIAGAALGLVALLVVYVIGIVVVDKGCFAVFGFLAMFVIIFPPLNGLGNAVGVYFVGSRGNETGSLLATLGFGFLGGLIMALLIFYINVAGDIMFGIEKIIIWGFVLLIGPIVATLGFNLTRRYKEPPPS